MFLFDILSENDDLTENAGQRVVTIFRNNSPVPHEVYLWKIGPGKNEYELEVRHDKKRIPIKLELDKIRQAMFKKGFAESLEVPDSGKIIEASMTNSTPTKKEGQFNRGVEKLIAAAQANPKLDAQVAVMVHDHPGSIAYGRFIRIGGTGLIYVKLNGGKLPNWASGDVIAVRPAEVYDVWDPKLRGVSVVHREYDDFGNRAVREDKRVTNSKNVQDLAIKYITKMLERGHSSRAAVSYSANMIYGVGVSHNEAMSAAIKAFHLITGEHVTEDQVN
jgi:hypothetical protein